MAQLTLMRQRIKTIETIEKITHAMRLIAMSSHTRLKMKQANLIRHYQEIESLFVTVRQSAPKWEHQLLKKRDHKPELFIVTGSQKGLCGNFNSAIMHLLRQTIHDKDSIEIITVGSRAHDFVVQKLGIMPVAFFNQFTAQTYLTIAHKIVIHLCAPQEQYKKVTVVGSLAKSFFNQVPQLHQLLPLPTPSATIIKDDLKYIFDESPDQLLDVLIKQVLMARLSCWFFETLIAEQAARFVSMDNSTRNAKNVLESTRLLYNKLRQAKITKELLEFACPQNDSI